MSNNLHKILALFISTLITVFCFNASFAGSVNYLIKGEILNLPYDSVGLYEYYGNDPILLNRIKLTKQDNKSIFELKGQVPNPGVYYLGFLVTPKEQFGTQILIGDDKQITFTANGESYPAFISTTQFIDAPSNEAFDFFWKKTMEYQYIINKAQQDMNQYGQSNPMAAQAYRQRVDSLFLAQADFHKSYINRNDLLGRISRAYLYEPYGYGNTMQQYASAEEHFQKAFIHQFNYKDEALGSLPVFFQKVSYFVNSSLVNHQYNMEKLMESLKPLYQQTPPKSKTREIFLFAAMTGAAQSQNNNSDAIDIYISYAKLYVNEFPNGRRYAECKQHVAQFGATLIGEQAPDIKLSSPDGKEYSLASLKGKVVLVDFWASWCGPCRKENPHVVHLYHKYHKKGFDIFSVSLDKDLNSWKEAIAKDKLEWTYHVSDLQGWQAAPAKLYNVSSIPKTFLLDKQGKIIAKDLRGAQLEAKLRDIFGE